MLRQVLLHSVWLHVQKKVAAIPSNLLSIRECGGVSCSVNSTVQKTCTNARLSSYCCHLIL